jgi:5,10-methylenetetrahydromethanopterin reductase
VRPGSKTFWPTAASAGTTGSTCTWPQRGRGVLLNVCLPISYVEERRQRLADAAARAGRDPADVELAMCVVVSPHEDPQLGRDAARRFLAVYLSLFPNVARETGLDPRFVERLRAVFSESGVDAAARSIDDAVVDRLTASGSVDDCRRRLEEYRAVGVQLPILSPVDGALELTIDHLA